MKKKRKKLGRKLLSFLLTLAMVVGLMPGMSLTAYAAEVESEEFTTNSGAGTYTGTHIKITGTRPQDSDGDSIDEDFPWTIQGLNGEIITRVDMTIGFYGGQDRVRHYSANHGTLANINDSDGGGFSFIDVNATSITIKDDDNDDGVYNLQIKKVVVYYTSDASIAVTGVTINPAGAQTIDVDGKVSFMATVSPENATDKKVKWSVGGTNSGAVKLYTDEACNTEVGADATDKLTVYAKGISAGSATVTCTSNADSSKSASCDVTVNEAQTQANDYSSLKNTTTAVTFDGKKWYLIDYDSSTVTLLSKECVGASEFDSNGSSNQYSGSTVETYVNNWYTNNITEDAKTAVNGSKAFLLTTDQAGELTTDVRICSKVTGTDDNIWWLCSSGNDAQLAACVYGFDGYVDFNGGLVDFLYGVRPALKLNLESVIFSSESKTFTVGTATVDVTGVSLDKTTAQTIDLDGKVSFTATVAPDNATDKKVKWSVGGTDAGAVKLYSDEACTTEVGTDATETLTVYAKGISAGSATVTATSNADSEKKASCDVTVNAAPDSVSYKAASVDETTHAVTFADATRTAYTVVTSSDEAVTWSEGWYVVKDTVTVSGLISFTGDVNLILCDGATLTVNGGVSVNEGNTLNIYAQSEGSTAGALTVSNVADYNAGIGGGCYGAGGTVTIHGGTVAVTGGSGGAGIGGGYEGIGGSVTIYGGTVNATGGGYGAGIGGGNHANGGDVTIYGGTVNATGGVQGAGIGGGNGYYNGSKTNGDGGTVTIHGGTVTATGGGYGAGIGGGAYGNGGTVTNNGGTVNATGGVQGAGIGGGLYGNGGTVTINGGDVTAIGWPTSNTYYGGAGIGGGCKGTGGTVTVNGGRVTAIGSAANGVLVPAIGHGESGSGDGALTVAATHAIYSSASAITEDNKDNAEAKKQGTGEASTIARKQYMLVDKGHVHEFTYSADGTTITATCESAGCTDPAYAVTLTVVAPTLTTYGQTGEGISAAATLTGLADFNTATGLTVSEDNIKYVGRDGTTYEESTTAPTDAGTYTASVTVGEGDGAATATADFEIAKAEVTVTAPTAKTLTYTGSEQELVNAGSTNDGTLYYAVTTENTAPTDDNLYTTSIPTATNAGTYYVWYRVIGDASHNDSVAACVTTDVAKKALTITADSDTKAYDNAALTKNSYTNTALAAGDSIDSVTITGTQTSVGSSANVPSAAVIKKGDTDVTANYDIAYANGTLTVTKAMTNNVTVSITGWTYGDDANAPSSTADFGADTVVYTYSDKADGTFTGAVPTHAGLWFVKAYVPGTENYVEGAAITSFNIAKKAVTVTAEAKSKTYGDADPDLTYVTEGLVGSDTLTGSLARAEGANVGTYAITQGTVDSNDYAITYVGANLTINRREIVISGINANDKDYDGNTDATLDYQYVTYGNIVAADAGKISVSAVGTFEDAQIGKGKTVSITGLTLSGEAIGNYVLAAEGQQEATTADICELENVTTDTNFVAKVKDFEGQVPTVTGLDLALALSLLTPAELAQYTNGEKLELSLEINKAGALMTDDVITLVTNALKDQENAKLDGAYYLDITLYVKVGNGAPRKITDLGGKTISITLDVPEDMYNHIWENRRTYYIVGVHSGVANVHASTTDHKITFDVGGFSVFALCYADVNVITYPSNTGSGTTATTAVTTVSPKTGGEDATDRLLLLMGTISAMIAIAAKVYEFRRRKEE